MKCKWYADFESVCTNGECPYRGGTCPTIEHPEACRYAEAAPEVLKLKAPRLSAKELAKTLRLCDSTSCVGCALFEFVDCGSAAKQQAADMLENLAAEKDTKKPEMQQRKPMIKITNTEDFGFVCNCAVRYCLMRRRTYAPATVMGFIKPLLSMLDDKTLYAMARDIADADNLGDVEIDAPMWAEFLAEIEKERKRRKSDENA